MPIAVQRALILLVMVLIAITAGWLMGQGQWLLTAAVVLPVLLSLAILYVPPAGFVGLFGLGVLIVPLPLLNNFQGISLIAGLALLIYLFQVLIGKRTLTLPNYAFSPLILLFMAWMLVRYLMDPSLPNLGGGGSVITGFRAWFGFAQGFFVFFALCLLLQERKDLETAIRWMFYGNLVLAVAAIIATFTGSFAVTLLLNRLGFHIGGFHEGVGARIQVLGRLGIFLVSLGLLRHIIGFNRFWGCVVAIIGILAIFSAQNRGTIIALVALICMVFFFQQKWVRLGAFLAFLTTGAVAGHIAGESGMISPDMRGARFLALVSPRMSELTYADMTNDFRILRWEAAVDTLVEKPIFGQGYGNAGLYNDVMLASLSWHARRIVEAEEALATGTTHNAYLSLVAGVGLPAGILIVAIILGCTYRSLRESYRYPNGSRENQLLIWAGVVLFVNAVVGNQFGGEFQVNYNWVLIAMALVIPHALQREEESRQGARCLGLCSGHPPRLHTPGQTDRERLYRILQRQATRRTAEHRDLL